MKKIKIDLDLPACGEVLNKTIGFLKWAELPKDILNQLTCTDGIEKCYISPDVNSLHILWSYKDGFVQHEIANYNSDLTILDFLDNEVGDDSWECFENSNIISFLDDYGNDINNIPVLYSA